MNVGGVVSDTVTLNEHEFVLPTLSVAEQVTTVEPRANVLPEAGVQELVERPELSTALNAHVGDAVGACPLVGET